MPASALWSWSYRAGGRSGGSCTSASDFHSPRPNRSRTFPLCSSTGRQDRWPVPPGSGARHQEPPCPPKFVFRNSRTCRRARLRAICRTSLLLSLHLLDDLFEVGSQLSRGNPRNRHPAIRVFANDDIATPERIVFYWIVFAKVGAAALLSLQGRERDHFRDCQQIL